MKCHQCSQPHCRQLTDNKYYCDYCKISHIAAFNLCMPHLWETYKWTQSLSFLTEACIQPQTASGFTSSTIGSEYVDTAKRKFCAQLCLGCLLICYHGDRYLIVNKKENDFIQNSISNKVIGGQ